MSHKLAKLRRLRQGQVEKEIHLMDRIIEQERLLRQMAEALEAAGDALERYADKRIMGVPDPDRLAQRLVYGALQDYRAAQDEAED